jgi:hypothetical protein
MAPAGEGVMVPGTDRTRPGPPRIPSDPLSSASDRRATTVITAVRDQGTVTMINQLVALVSASW